MTRNILKSYAPQARRDFIKSVTDRAAHYGLTKGSIEPITEQGDVAIIAGKAYPRTVAAKRKRLEKRIKRQGFEQVMESMAYTWFNRFVAIRFMELHGYFDHGYRVLSHPEGSATPEIVEHAEHVDLSGLDREAVIELKLEGTKEAELYRMLLIAQCNALHKVMPSLFASIIDDEAELLLPENLLHSDSVVRKLVHEIPEDEWKEVEIIGWLYQFYISEKKDEVIGKVVKSEDIPAATQLFTPNWIVKYMVQNTLGRQWMATYPKSPLKKQMEFYIEPAEQTPEVQEQLKAITPESLNPEELTLLDPACGSGHILVEAYDLLKAIYQERGYRAKDIPRLILEKNLYGLEIDDRAAQLAAFALMMKARADDRRMFENETEPHVVAIQESKGIDARKITEALNAPILTRELPPCEFVFEELEDARTPLFIRNNLSVKGEIYQSTVEVLIDLFEHGKTFGSLIRVPKRLAEKLPEIAKRVKEVLAYGEMFGQAAAKQILPFVKQARLLSDNYNAVLMNPPYMGSRYFNAALKRFVKVQYEAGAGDLCTAFMMRNKIFATPGGRIGMITIPNWMFLPTFESLRCEMTQSQAFESLTHNGRGVFGADFGSCAFVLLNSSIEEYRGTFRRLFDVASFVVSNEELLDRFLTRPSFHITTQQLTKVPGTPIAYWIDKDLLRAFEEGQPFGQSARPRQGLATGDNDRFLRFWAEVDNSSIGWNIVSRNEALRSGKRWFPYSKGGSFRRWYGNNYLVVNWKNDGDEVRNFYNNKGTLRSRPQNLDFFFKPAITWSLTSVSQLGFAARYRPAGCIFDINGMSAFTDTDLFALLSLLNSVVAFETLKVINPTFSFQAGDIARIPTIIPSCKEDIEKLTEECIAISKQDWDAVEISWDFSDFPLLNEYALDKTVAKSFENWSCYCESNRKRLLELEREINSAYVLEYDLRVDVQNAVSEEQIVLNGANRENDVRLAVSYAIGCMMGRYSLDKPGLIYAHSSNKGFDPSQYRSFPADDDGIIPITDIDWFEDDAANQVVEFIGVAWPKEHLEENLKFVAESIGPKRGESSRETIRRYLTTGFFKHHLWMYKKRPIYWLFSSGKQRAFQCLVYLHRYHEGTLARMRTEYVIPLQGKISARIEQLAGDITSATSSAHRKKLERERDKLIKQQAELQDFDEKLRHYADQRISLDLDDGVKVNYGQFGDLLAEVKAVTGKRPD